MLLATVLTGAIVKTNQSNNERQKRIDTQIKKMQIDIEGKTEQQKLDIEKKINELEAKLQAKKKEQEEKAKQSLLAKVVPHAEAAPAPVSYGGTCQDWMVQAGVNDMANASELIRRESGCNPNATNRSSGAFGIPQALPASKIAYCGSDPVCQIKWMQSYCIARYGSWANAVAFHNRMNWY